MKSVPVSFHKGVVNFAAPLVPEGAGVLCRDVDLHEGTFRARPDIIRFAKEDANQTAGSRRFRPYPTGMAVVTLPSGDSALFVVEPFEESGKRYTQVKVFKGLTFESADGSSQPTLPEPIVVMDTSSGVRISGQAVEPVEFVTAGNYLYLVNFGHPDCAAFATYRIDLHSLQGSYQEFGAPGSRAPAAAHGCIYHGFFAAANIRTSFDLGDHRQFPLRVEFSDAPLGDGQFKWNGSDKDTDGDYNDKGARYYYDVPAHSGDSITKVVELGGNLIAFTGHGAFAGSGVPGQTFSFERILSLGCLDPETVKLVERPGEKGYIYFLGSDGLPKRVDGTPHMVENVGALEDGRSPVELTMRKYVAGAFLVGTRRVEWMRQYDFSRCAIQEYSVEWRKSKQTLLEFHDTLTRIVTPYEGVKLGIYGHHDWNDEGSDKHNSWTAVPVNGDGKWLYQTFHADVTTCFYEGWAFAEEWSWNLIRLYLKNESNKAVRVRVQLRNNVSGIEWEGEPDAPIPANHTGAWFVFRPTAAYRDVFSLHFNSAVWRLHVFCPDSDASGVSLNYQAVSGSDYPRGDLYAGEGGGGVLIGDARFNVGMSGYLGYMGYAGRHPQPTEPPLCKEWKGEGVLVSEVVTLAEGEEFGLLQVAVDKQKDLGGDAVVELYVSNPPPGGSNWVDVTDALPNVYVQRYLPLAQRTLQWRVTLKTTKPWLTPTLSAVSLNIIADFGTLSHIPSAVVWDNRYCLMLKRNPDVPESYDTPVVGHEARNGDIELRDMMVFDGAGWSVWEAVGAMMAAAMKDTVGRPRLLMIDGEAEGRLLSYPSGAVIDPGFVRLTTFGVRLARDLSWRPPWPRFISGAIPLGDGLDAGRIHEINALARNEVGIPSADLYISATAEGNAYWVAHTLTVRCGTNYFGFKDRAALCVGRMAQLALGFGSRTRPQKPLEVAVLAVVVESLGPRFQGYRTKATPRGLRSET